MALQITTTTTPIARSAKVTQPVEVLNAGSTNTAGPASRTDSVKLSTSAQIHLYKSQGLSAHQIAANLGVDLKSIAGYFPPAASQSTPAPEADAAAVKTDAAAVKAPLPAAVPAPQAPPASGK